MYTVTKTQQGPYEAYVLADTTADTTVTVVPAKGGMVTGMTKNGEEYCWLRHPNFEENERPRCAVPVLFPCCGRVDNGVHTFGGTEYPMDIHGMAHSLPWEMAGTDTADGAKITVRLTDSAESRKFYPYSFCVEIDYVLQGNVLTFAQRYKNTGSDAMPFSFGFHPYFTMSEVQNLDWDIKAATLVDMATGAESSAPAAVDFPFNESGSDTARYYKGVQSPMVFADKGLHHKVTIRFDEHFTNAVLWSQCDLGFVCVEPWNGWPNSLNAGQHEVLNAGEALHAVMSVEMG